MDASDSQLVRDCLAGHAAAWEALVERYGRLVYSIPRRYGLQPGDADDVFQSVFSILHRRLGTLQDHSKLSSWLITTAHRESWRIGKRSSSGAHLDETIPDVSSPSDEQIEAWERQHLVRAGLRALGGRCEELLTALFLGNEAEHSDYQAIAARLKIPVGSIGPTRARCLKKLEQILINQGFTAPENPPPQG